MAEQSACGLRQRRKSGLPLNTDGGQVNDKDTTPTPTAEHAQTLKDFKNIQHSFDIAVDECDEEEIPFDSDDEGPDEKVARRPVTPTPLQDFGVSVQHSEVPLTASEFLKVSPAEQDCFTDVSDAEDDEEEE
ncbi:uncharacterized protein [Epargyreus clarus]|uniref:uncharacterized protein n=1 Tax=Epargyreus clarus TaxID=520877 RepID=UPI003C2E8E3A